MFIIIIIIFVPGQVVIPGTELITCVLKNNVLVAAATIKSSFEDFGATLGEDVGFSMVHARHFKNILLKIGDFNGCVFMRIFLNSID